MTVTRRAVLALAGPAAAAFLVLALAPPPGRLVAVLVGAVLAVAVCTAIPAAFGARRPVADVLSAESA
jgi:uncharacterized membrane protein YraQ (UPF0718 family)